MLLDTHSWAWAITLDDRMSASARHLMKQAERVLVSPISIFEIAQKANAGKWPEMVPYVDRLPQLIEEMGGEIAPLTPVVCKLAGVLQWEHRDPFDRMLAATAIGQKMPILSIDKAFDSLQATQGWVARVW